MRDWDVFLLCRSRQRHQCSQTMKILYNDQFPLLDIPGGNHDWIVLMNTTSMIPCRRVSWRELAIIRRTPVIVNEIWFDSNRHISNTLQTRMVTIHEYFCIIRDGGWSRHVLKICKRVKTMPYSRENFYSLFADNVLRCVEKKDLLYDRYGKEWR